jgi:hypothetical protein
MIQEGYGGPLRYRRISAANLKCEEIYKSWFLPKICYFIRKKWMSILSRDNFLALFSDYAICAGKYKDNRVEGRSETINNISITKAESLNGMK